MGCPAYAHSEGGEMVPVFDGQEAIYSAIDQDVAEQQVLAESREAQIQEYRREGFLAARKVVEIILMQVKNRSLCCDLILRHVSGDERTNVEIANLLQMTPQNVGKMNRKILRHFPDNFHGARR